MIAGGLQISETWSHSEQKWQNVTICNKDYRVVYIIMLRYILSAVWCFTLSYTFYTA